jgi:hypothetical protein
MGRGLMGSDGIGIEKWDLMEGDRMGVERV